MLIFFQGIYIERAKLKNNMGLIMNNVSFYENDFELFFKQAHPDKKLFHLCKIDTLPP